MIDILLTDFTNQVADTLTGEGESQPGDGDEQADDGDAVDSEPEGGEDETTEPDDSGGGSAAGGETLFVENNCGACHCADAGGGCALDAPPLAGTTVETLTDYLTGIEPHSGGQVELSDGDFADLQAYLASL